MQEVKNCLTCSLATFIKEYDCDEELAVTCHALDGISIPSCYGGISIRYRPENYWGDGTPERDEITIQDEDYPFLMTNCPA